MRILVKTVAARLLVVALFWCAAMLWLAACRSGPLADPSTPAQPRHRDARTLLSDTGPKSASALDEPAIVPMSLTAADGTGLRLATLDVRGVIEDPLALTELELVFDNPRNETIEGRFEIALPVSARVTRFAMEIDGRWQEAEVVERREAQRTYESFLHQQRDPALLERESGNRFSARVFPIAPRGRKRLLLSYTQALVDPREPYRVLTHGLPWLERLRVRIVERRDGEPRVVERTMAETAPSEDIVIERGTAQSDIGRRHGTRVVARVQPFVATKLDAAPPLQGVTIVVDTSASRALDHRHHVERLGQIVRSLARSSSGPARLRVLAFDQTVVPIYDGPLTGFDDRARAELVRRQALGASDLGRALAAIAEDPQPRVILFTDGMATAGVTDSAALRDRVAALGERGVQRLDVVATGAIQDRERLRSLTSAALPEAGLVLAATDPPDTIAERLLQRTIGEVAITVPGASWWSPQRLSGVHAQSQVFVVAELPPKARELTVAFSGAATGRARVRVQTGQPALVDDAFFAAKIDALIAGLAERDDDDRTTQRDRIVQLSVEHRIFNDLTALLVLETEDDYRRFGLPRRALASVLMVEGDGVIARSRIEPERVVRTPNRRAGSWSPRRVRVSAPEATGEPVGRTITMDEFRNIPTGVGTSRDFTQVIESSKTGSRDVAGVSVAGRSGSEMNYAVEGANVSASGSSRHGAARRGRTNDILRSIEGSTPAYDGVYARVRGLLDRGATKEAIRQAWTWYAAQPDDLLALVALGEAATAVGDRSLAARAYGSIIDHHPSRAELRRFAGARLEALGEPGLALAIDTYKKARTLRPDHPSSHRHLAYALLRRGRARAAFEVLAKGLQRPYPEDRFPGVLRILQDDLGIIAAAWLRSDPKAAPKIHVLLSQLGATLPTEPTLRVVLTWETDANDVDLHVFDRAGRHAFYQARQLASGGKLFNDVRDGYGPECFAIDGDANAHPYRIAVRYFRRGPMGFGIGKVQIVHHDGAGRVSIEDRPFVAMREHAVVDLGEIKPARRSS